MKITPLLVALALCGHAASQTHGTAFFHRHFYDSTLRIDYHRIGNRSWDTVADFDYIVCGMWAGSRRMLTDPFDNGAYRVVVTDTAEALTLYSRCFNTLFNEYRDTDKGADSTAVFEEVARVPLPRHKAHILLQKRGSDGRFHTQRSLFFDGNHGNGHRETAFSNCAEKAPRCVKYGNYKAVPLHRKGNPHHKLDIVIVPEGYGPADTLKMRRDMQRFCDYILAHEPFVSRMNDFNIWGIPLTGETTGITDPCKGIFVQSLLGASYNTFGSDRYLMTMNLWQLHDVIASTPCDQIVIMANSNTYGGGAIYNFYAMSSMCDMAYMILPHELGHSIGGLADEYVDEQLSYGDMHGTDVEPCEPNITNLVSFASKWKTLLPLGTQVPTLPLTDVPDNENGPIGVYEGAGYHAKGIYRPFMHCMMRDYAPFCPVCARRLNEVFDLYIK